MIKVAHQMDIHCDHCGNLEVKDFVLEQNKPFDKKDLEKEFKRAKRYLKKNFGGVFALNGNYTCKKCKSLARKNPAWAK